MQSQNRLLRLAVLLLPSLILTACTTEPPRSQPIERIPQPVSQDEVPDENIDYEGLARSLEMEGHSDDLGYREKSFNTCHAGYGYSSTHKCRNLRFITISFQLQCRQSEGSESDTNYDVSPITESQVKWQLGKDTGMTSTNGEGYGKILWATDASRANSKLRITVDGHFLTVKANEVRKVVTPGSWCSGR